jgi:hypothetical protein
MFISIDEARDIHLSDIRNLEESLWTLQKEFGIIPQKDKQGTPMWYADYILEKEKTNARKKKQV